MLRGLRASDAEDVAALYRAAFGDERPIDAAEIVSWLENEELEPEGAPHQGRDDARAWALDLRSTSD